MKPQKWFLWNLAASSAASGPKPNLKVLYQKKKILYQYTGMYDFSLKFLSLFWVIKHKLPAIDDRVLANSTSSAF